MEALLAGGKSRAATLAWFVGSIWLVSWAHFLLPLHLAWLGVHPRTLSGLVGIVSAPWLHASLAHLISNTFPLLVLGWLTMYPKKTDFAPAVVGSMLGAGLLAWVIGGTGTVHIGASGVVFGLGGFVVARGYFARRFTELLSALPATGLYGMSMLFGVLPIYPGVSWQSHLGGIIGGILTAKLMYSSNIRTNDVN
ncbi:protease [Novimethylophilus kurashikiensis]|uniref:Protease n=1 Tax=Novimethylophilus kurashikiensis TaxID=1825523 RepID=A0A2R5F9P6_9PROT|nr:rhomboid family intramembrane serine protease [Novimethylophilus kurashikiensis]GBG14539.1 protease [Novimethylophilus kurashikiensis]